MLFSEASSFMFIGFDTASINFSFIISSFLLVLYSGQLSVHESRQCQSHKIVRRV